MEGVVLFYNAKPPNTWYDEKECKATVGGDTPGRKHFFYLQDEDCVKHSSNMPVKHLKTADVLWAKNWEKLNLSGPKLITEKDGVTVHVIMDDKIPRDPTPGQLIGDFQNFSYKEAAALLKLVWERVPDLDNDFMRERNDAMMTYLMGTYVTEEFATNRDKRCEFLLLIGTYHENVCVTHHMSRNLWRHHTLTKEQDSTRFANGNWQEFHFQRRYALGMFRHILYWLREKTDSGLGRAE